MVEPHEIVWQLCTSGVPARCLQVVADLGIADRIPDEPVPVADLAGACGADPDALDRVLRLLAAHAVFEHSAGGYGHTAASRLLREDQPMSMRAFVSMMGLPAIWNSLTALEHAVRTGRPGLETLEPEGFWAYLQGRPDQAQVFGRAMTAKAGADIAAVLASYDFAGFHTVADIGGGRGHLLRAVLDGAPAVEGVLFDLPDVVGRFELDGQRLTLQAGDFFQDPLPPADGYLLMEVIHDWDDDAAVKILRAARRAARPGSRLLIIENVLDDDRPDPRGQILDIIMLTVTGGRERTAGELGVLLTRAGWRPGAVSSTPGPMRIQEARAD